jgi:hypothetical protein
MLYVCEYCEKVYKTPAGFLNHSCKEKQRLDEIKTPIGQIALIYYEKWMRMQYGRTFDTTTFMTSRFYNAFIKFAHFVKKIKGFVNSDEYVKLMITNKFMPSLWCDARVYIKYIKHIDSVTTTNEKITSSFYTLYSIAEANDCTIDKVFKYIPAYTIMQLMYEQKLSPWVLLHSGKFMAYVMGLSEEEQILLEDFINPGIWKQTFDANPKSIAVIKKCIKQLKL